MLSFPKSWNYFAKGEKSIRLTLQKYIFCWSYESVSINVSHSWSARSASPMYFCCWMSIHVRLSKFSKLISIYNHNHLAKDFIVRFHQKNMDKDHLCKISCFSAFSYEHWRQHMEAGGRLIWIRVHRHYLGLG